MLIDTFSTFLKHWNGTEESWLRYIQEYPELFEKIKWDYERYKMDWREYPKLLTKRDTEELKLAYDVLLKVLPEVEQRIKRLFKVEGYNVVIYVGLENGAGWVTEFMGRPSILFGLEAIAELNWYKRLEGLVAHEFGHLVHWVLRKENIEKLEDAGMMWLYTEGFAQRIEDLTTGRPWHLEEEGWLEWCEEHEELLKREFLRRVDLRRVENEEPLNPLFGSWYQLFGRQFLGYYLGYRFILNLEERLPLDEIARMDKEKIKGELLKFLRD